MELAITAGAEDIVSEGDHIEVITTPGDYHKVLAAIQAKGFEVEDSSIAMRASTMIPVSEEDAEALDKLISALDDLDDVQSVYTNASFDEA